MPGGEKRSGERTAQTPCTAYSSHFWGYWRARWYRYRSLFREEECLMWIRQDSFEKRKLLDILLSNCPSMARGCCQSTENPSAG